MKKTYLILSFIIIGILLSSTVISLSAYDNIMTGVYGKVKKFINANSCNKDDICEINFASISNGLNVDEGDATFEGKLIALNDVELPQLAGNGNGNAYACLDSQGKLFRSETPCN